MAQSLETIRKVDPETTLKIPELHQFEVSASHVQELLLVFGDQIRKYRVEDGNEPTDLSDDPNGMYLIPVDVLLKMMEYYTRKDERPRLNRDRDLKAEKTARHQEERRRIFAREAGEREPDNIEWDDYTLELTALKNAYQIMSALDQQMKNDDLSMGIFLIQMRIMSKEWEAALEGVESFAERLRRIYQTKPVVEAVLTKILAELKQAKAVFALNYPDFSLEQIDLVAVNLRQTRDGRAKAFDQAMNRLQKMAATLVQTLEKVKEGIQTPKLKEVYPPQLQAFLDQIDEGMMQTAEIESNKG